jgi:hypothetical protein
MFYYLKGIMDNLLNGDIALESLELAEDEYIEDDNGEIELESMKNRAEMDRQIVCGKCGAFVDLITMKCTENKEHEID